MKFEVQMVAIAMGKITIGQWQIKKKTIFSERVDDLFANERGSQDLFKDIYLICGTEDAFIILSYLERNQEKILKEKKKLREIFEDGVRQYSYTSREVQQVDKECSSICQMI
ncbi:unnamed protein product [Paramecium octaurelia]|uniref:Uncharacterized protein n=1 Tax=Paramecium octaurelia TaxID=43137 RepID=A0A8S1SVC8_PAROT|nr:unnamed protein product [Paramecium octaurelia]